MANQYWQQRILKQSEKLYDKTLLETQQQLAGYYKTSLKDVQTDMGALWDTLLSEAKDGEIKPNDLYKFGRYYQMQNQLHDKLNTLGNHEIDINNQKYTDLYNSVSSLVSGNIPSKYIKDSFVVLPDNRVQQVLNSVWCADGKNWSTRIWDNKTLLQQRIEKGMLDSVARGVSKDEMVKQLQQSFGVGFNDADRLARTELAHIQNTATTDSYKQAGIQQVKTIVADDERLCDECSAHDGEIHSIDDAGAGVSYLFHANCRCCVIAVMDE